MSGPRHAAPGESRQPARQVSPSPWRKPAHVISFIVPAYNEEQLLGRTLEALTRSARAVGEPFELIVVDDDSTDRTAELARAGGARVVEVKAHRIAAVRNAGAREARGEILIFVDADTLVPEATLRAALRALRGGAAGGGAWVRIEGPVPRAVRLAARLFARVWFGLCRWAAGCFIFVRRDAFEAVGGFDERYYVGEELYFSRAIKRLGHFAMLREAVVSSGRKARLYAPRHVLRTALALLFRGPRMWRDRDGLDMWYDGRREGGERR